MKEKFFKDPKTGDLYSYPADGSQDKLIDKKLVPITKSTMAALTAMSPERKKELADEKAAHEKKLRKASLKVVTANNTFSASIDDIIDMLIAVVIHTEPTIKWKNINGAEVDVQIEELKEALALALAYNTKEK